jgi:uncharacterized membrane protein
MASRLTLLLLLSCGLALGCAGAGQNESASGAKCGQGAGLDYASFGESFMRDYCTACHSSELEATQRSGAPSDHDFDTHEGILRTPLEHLDHVAGAGAHVVNTTMPPAGYPQPTRQEREDLAQWLACGAP